MIHITKTQAKVSKLAQSKHFTAVSPKQS